MTRSTWPAKLAILVLLAMAPVMRAADLDEDGIEDSLEQMLIDMYRPMLHYDNAEDVAPVSVDWYIRHSELILRVTFPPGEPLEHQDFIVYSNS
jgi:hypothetical protein